MTRFSSSTTKDGSGVARNFKTGGGGHNFHIFSSVIFFGRTNLKLTKKPGKFQGSLKACSPWKFLKICML